MRKLLLLSVVAFTVLSTNAQVVFSDNSFQKNRSEESPVLLKENQNNPVARSRGGASRSVSNSVKLNSQRLGSAGNLLTVNNGNANQIDVNDSLNIVTFIHRNDPTQFGGTVATYRFDLSRNGGTTFTSNIGSITNNPRIDNVLVNGRFPQACIFNPAGNTVQDSAYLIYTGTWHNGTDGWKGSMRGRGQIGDTASFNVNIDSANGGAVNVAAGFCQGAPGVFWNINQDYPGNAFQTGAQLITRGIIIEKGVWNPTTRDVEWTEERIPVSFSLNSAGTSTAATSFNIAFDPTGQYGWIACLGDLNSDNRRDLNPIFWRTIDGGDNWTGPIQVRLDSMPEIKAELNPQLSNGDPSSGVPGTAFDADLVVDYLGNPHMEVIVGNGGGEYSVQAARYTAWDISYTDPSEFCATGWNGWKGTVLGPVATLRGTLSNDNPAPQTQDNRPLAARSADGKKLFFFWVDSDIDFVGADQNDLPNMFTKAFDLEHSTSTKVWNLTEGDSLWGGETLSTPGGLFGGAAFGTIAPVASKKGDTYNVPVILTQIDYNHDPADGLGSYLNPCAFWYINNVNFDPYDFSEGKAARVELNGVDTVKVRLGADYDDELGSIIYVDTTCHKSGELHLEVDSSSVDYNELGSYRIRYYAKDNDGVIWAAKTRVIMVGREPEAGFTVAAGNPSYRLLFKDTSTYGPTSWKWEFGDNRTGNTQNPFHLYEAKDATYTVCLTTANAYGTSTKTCKDIAVKRVGINDPKFAESINLFPNPTNGKVIIKLADYVATETYVSVINVLGETVVSPVKYAAGNNQIEMNLANLANGLYLVKIAAEGGTAIKRLTLNK